MKYRHKETGVIYHHDYLQKMWEYLTNSAGVRTPGKVDAAVNSRDDVSSITHINQELGCAFEEHCFCYSCVAAHQVSDTIDDCDEHDYGTACKHCPLISNWRYVMPCLHGLYDDWWFSHIDTRPVMAAKIAALPVVNTEWEPIDE